MQYLKTKTHISWIITAICLGFLGGVALAKLLPDEVIDVNRFNFLLVAVVIFLLVKGINRLRRKKEEAPPAPPQPSEEVLLLREIRDNLKK